MTGAEVRALSKPERIDVRWLATAALRAAMALDPDWHRPVRVMTEDQRLWARCQSTLWPSTDPRDLVVIVPWRMLDVVDFGYDRGERAIRHLTRRAIRLDRKP